MKLYMGCLYEADQPHEVMDRKVFAPFDLAKWFVQVVLGQWFMQPAPYIGTIMIEYVANDGGRKAAGYKGLAGDCAARAIAIATGLPYKDVYAQVATANKNAGFAKSARNGVSWKIMPQVIQSFGLVKVTLPKGPRPTFTEAHHRYGNCIVTTNGHVVALVDGAMHDTFDGRMSTYQGVTSERKARSVYVLPGKAKNPAIAELPRTFEAVGIEWKVVVVFHEAVGNDSGRRAYHVNSKVAGLKDVRMWRTQGHVLSEDLWVKSGSSPWRLAAD